MSAPSTGLAHSVQTRLVQHAKAIGMDPNLVLARFAVECGLLQHGPDACAGEVPAFRETPQPYGDTAPGGYEGL